MVYKVDRLTRSLADFAKLVELFDAHGVSFVSVTQQFNTTTSMGRLTLNVLLSFAQFEREVTSERIRDKIGASKRKGLVATRVNSYSPYPDIPVSNRRYRCNFCRRAFPHGSHGGELQPYVICRSAEGRVPPSVWICVGLGGSVYVATVGIVGLGRGLCDCRGRNERGDCQCGDEGLHVVSFVSVVRLSVVTFRR